MLPALSLQLLGFFVFFTRAEIQVVVDANHFVGKVHQFWKSTGLCPPDPHNDAQSYLLSNDMFQNLAWIGAIPRESHDFQVRIHWLLELVKGNFSEKTFYNFTLLDQFLAELVEGNDLKPGFELMGNPANIFTDFEDEVQVYLWKDFIASLGKRYYDKYGSKRVNQWNFETWNEPVLHHFDSLNMTVQGFLNYYDACSRGLRETEPRISFGGPGGECKDPNSTTSLCWFLLEHCSRGPDYFTKKKGPLRIDFISLHKKGSGVSDNILEAELKTLSDIYRLYPNLQKVTVFNDEADPMVDWSKPYWWRQDATYAAIATKVLAQHIKFYSLWHPDISFGLLSNDNAFLSYYPHQFSQRTLMARFQMNNTQPSHTQLIRKPIHAVMALWNKLEENILFTKSTDKICQTTVGSRFGVVATASQNVTHSDFQVSILMYNSADTQNISGDTKVRLIVYLSPSIAPGEMAWVQYTVDNIVTNPYEVWRRAGKPDYPCRDVLKKMRQQEEPYRIGHPTPLSSSGKLEVNITLSLPGVTLIQICQTTKQLEQIGNVRFIPVFEDQVLITWKGLTTKCILTYEVQFSNDSVHFQRVNTEDIIFSAFHYHCNEKNACAGYYRIRAIDYWNRAGPYSNTTRHDKEIN